jgi:5-methyltetrahydrofolate--homocysteine methyltransferase
MVNAKVYGEAFLTGRTEKIRRLIQGDLENGEFGQTILEQGLIPAMADVGTRFKNNEIYIPEVLAAALVMRAGIDLIKPYLIAATTRSDMRIVIGTVEDDLHDIGKNLVRILFEGAGFEVFDMGVNVKTEDFLTVVKEKKPHVLGMSALLTTTMLHMKSTVDALAGVKLRGQVKVIVGGAPVTEGFANEIGADGYAPDAYSAVEMVKKIVFHHRK